MKKLICVYIFCFIFSVWAQDYWAFYNDAYKLLESGQPAEARLKFEQVRKSPIDMGLRDNAEYWIAVSYYDEKRYEKAIEHYRIAQTLPDGNKAAAAQFELALSEKLSGDTSAAIIEFYRFTTMYPTEKELIERARATIDSLGGPTQAKTPDSGPVTPTLAKVKAAPKPAREKPEVATSGPLTGAELPVPAKRKTAEAEKKTKELPIQASDKAKEAVQVNAPEKRTEAEPIKPPEESVIDTAEKTTEEVAETIPEPTPDITEPEIKTKPDIPVDSEGEPLESLPTDADPRSLIRPEDKRGL